MVSNIGRFDIYQLYYLRFLGTWYNINPMISPDIEAADMANIKPLANTDSEILNHAP